MKRFAVVAGTRQSAGGAGAQPNAPTGAGNPIYASGQLSLDAATDQLVGRDDVKAETEHVMKNVVAVLAASGFAIRDVVKCHLFVKNLAGFTALNDAYGCAFDARPAKRLKSAPCTKGRRWKFRA